MSDPVEQQLQSLANLSKTKLYELWRQLFQDVPNPKIRRPLMIRVLAYRIQERAYRSINAATENHLRRLATVVGSAPNSDTSSTTRIQAGTRLVREWRDQVHLVNVQESGYEYRGERYKSLSEIARLITGTRWSGPLFFGIKSNSTNTSQGVQ